MNLQQGNSHPQMGQTVAETFNSPLALGWGGGQRTPCHFPLSTACQELCPAFLMLYFILSSSESYGTSTNIISPSQMEGTEAQKGRSTCPRSNSTRT